MKQINETVWWRTEVISRWSRQLLCNLAVSHNNKCMYINVNHIHSLHPAQSFILPEVIFGMRTEKCSRGTYGVMDKVKQDSSIQWMLLPAEMARPCVISMRVPACNLLQVGQFVPQTFSLIETSWNKVVCIRKVRSDGKIHVWSLDFCCCLFSRLISKHLSYVIEIVIPTLPSFTSHGICVFHHSRCSQWIWAEIFVSKKIVYTKSNCSLTVSLNGNGKWYWQTITG